MRPPVRHPFSTLIDEMPLGDAALRSRLERAAWVLSEDDTAGNDWCEQEGYPGYTSYASLDDLPERFPEFGALKKLLDKAAAKFAAALHWDMDGLALELDALWVNVLGEGGHHSGHIHPGSVISGTYYVCVPEGRGADPVRGPAPRHDDGGAAAGGQGAGSGAAVRLPDPGGGDLPDVGELAAA